MMLESKKSNESLRKVMRLGRSALCITLPKPWVKYMGIKEDDYVAVKVNGAHLQISKIEKGATGPPVCIVNVDVCTEPNAIKRVIVGAYIACHDIIWLQSKRPFTNKQIEEINDIVRKLVGLHISDSSDNIIILQNLTTPLRPTIDSSIRRFHSLITEMFETTISILVDGDQEKAIKVRLLNEECNRLYWLLVRQLIRAINEPSVRDTLEISSSSRILSDRLVAGLLKKCADLCESMLQSVDEVLTNCCGVEKKVVDWLISFSTSLKKELQNAIESLLSRDLVLANKTINKLNFLNDEKIEDGENLFSSSQSCRLYLFRIIHSLREIGECYRQIAEEAINRAMEESGKLVTIEYPSYVESALYKAHNGR